MAIDHATEPRGFGMFTSRSHLLTTFEFDENSSIKFYGVTCPWNLIWDLCVSTLARNATRSGYSRPEPGIPSRFECLQAPREPRFNVVLLLQVNNKTQDAGPKVKQEVDF